MKKILSPAYSLKLKNIILLLNRGLFFFKWSYSQRCFKVAQRCKNRRWKWQFNVEIYNVVSTLLKVVNFNVVSTLIWRCATLRRHINLKATLNRRWNVCWVRSPIEELFGERYSPTNNALAASTFVHLTHK